MKTLYFLALFSLGFCQEAKLSLFLINNLEKGDSCCDELFSEAEKSACGIKIYQGEFSKKAKESIDQLSRMKVDATLVSKELLSEDLGELQKGSLHLLTSNLLNQKGALIDQTWVFSQNGIEIGFFGLSNYAFKPPQNFTFLSLDPSFAALQKVKEMKKKGVDFIVLICSLNKTEILSLVKKVEGIDVILTKEKSRALPFFENQTLVYFQESSGISRLDLLIEKKQTAQGFKVDFYPTWKKCSKKILSPLKN